MYDINRDMHQTEAYKSSSDGRFLSLITNTACDSSLEEEHICVHIFPLLTLQF